MKKMILAVFVVMAVSFQMAQAQTAPTTQQSEEKDSNYPALWLLGGVAEYFVVHISVHESMHALAAGLASDWEVVGFRPYPHRSDNGESLVFGDMSSRCLHPDPISGNCVFGADFGMITLTPYIADVAMFAVSDIMLSTGVVTPNSAGGKILFFVGMAAPWLDVAFNSTFSSFEGSDADFVAKSFHIPKWSVIAIGSGISAVGVWRLWINGKRAFGGSHPAVKENRHLTVTPMVGPGTFGASTSFRF